MMEPGSLAAFIVGWAGVSAVVVNIVRSSPRNPAVTCSDPRAHRVVALEQEVYNEARSPDEAAHVKACSRRALPPIPPSKVARAKVDIYRDTGDGPQLATRAGEHFMITRDEQVRFRELVAECEAIKQVITDLESIRDLTTHIAPDDGRVAELKAVLQVKVDEVGALARSWESDPQNGPGATRIC